MSKLVRRLPAHWPLIVALLAVAGLVAGTAVAYLRTQERLTVVVASQQSVRVAGPLSVDFSQDIAPGFKASLEPKVAGTWHEQRTLLGVTSISFTPSGRFQPTQKYQLRITGMKRVLVGAALPEVKQTFKTQQPAQISSVSPHDGATGVPTKTQFKVTLSSANDGVRTLRPSLSPAVPLKLVSNNDKQYIWMPVEALKQGATYVFTLEDVHITDPAMRKMTSTSFRVVTEPGIVSARTGGLFAPGQTVDINFDQPIEPDTSKFTFDLAGKSVWADDRTLKFTPDAIKPGETHAYKVKAGLRTKAGGVLEADRDFTFATNGPVSATASPGGGGNGLTVPIRIAFDQAVDHASAQARFSISPASPGTFSWSGNTMTYSPAGLSFQTDYNYGVSPGVVPVWGLPSARGLGGSFVTALQTIKLNVPLYKQPYASSCELTALRMVLAFRGITTDEVDIVNRVGFSPRNRDTATNTWDDPNVMFVGALNGLQGSTAYGVHADPIAKAARTYGHSATAIHGLSAQYISARIHEGNPVIFWGHSYPTKADSWNTPGGGVVQTWINSHARVVVGVVGSADAPSGFYINDSWGGKAFYWSTGELMANINTLGSISNMGVVVY